ncbi:cytochrome P450 2D3 [Folsomia candida]|uniref:cytochrome P450 2D3 n=1 Tax=Folsomia candida TaxID=158441 RepID=UPI000B8FED1D|nr:cytochrome P450 2D3 [Folsomia candida]XP_035703300.1 cytochrome P450 2D3 [Folsomia candida]
MGQKSSSVDFLEMFFWSVVGGLLLFHLFKKLLLFQRMPPGPYGFPVIGRLIHLLKTDSIDEFKKYKKQYGDIFSFSCGDHYVIVINGYKNIQEVSKREDLSGRPDFHVWDIRNFGKRNRGILFCQTKLQAEIDNVIGNRPAHRDDKPKSVNISFYHLTFCVLLNSNVSLPQGLERYRVAWPFDSKGGCPLSQYKRCPSRSSSLGRPRNFQA